MHLPRVLNTATFRLAAVYLPLFAISVSVLGVILYLLTAASLEQRSDTHIETEMNSLMATFASGGLARLVSEVRTHQQTFPEGPMEYLLADAKGARLAGNLPAMPVQLGWSNVHSADSDGDINHRRILVAALAGGARLAIASNREEIDETEKTIIDGLASAFAAVIAFGIIGGVALSLAILRRVEIIRRTAEAIIAGDLTQRAPVGRGGDEFDRLSKTLNQMLDRISELMESLRHVSANIAHDLKNPLARLRRGLEATRMRSHSVEERDAAVELAIAQVDEILAIFDALLRIAQIEAGTRRAAFRDVDLSAVFAHVVEAFAPAATDAGKRLNVKIQPGLITLGDKELLAQMMVNLVENAIGHTPVGTLIEVTLASDGDRIVGTIRDNGPGVIPEEHERIFERFYRSEASRSIPGNGLGLSLVRAVASIHGIQVEVRDAGPGLLVKLIFRPA